MNNERYCVLCKHWDFFGGSRGYSELTPGVDAAMSCSKGHWDRSCLYDIGEDGFRQVILTARTCKDFSPVPMPKV